MKNAILTIFTTLLFASFNSHAQVVEVRTNSGKSFSFPDNQFVKDSANFLKFSVKDNVSDVTEFFFSKAKDITSSDVETDGNKIRSIRFLKEHNPMLLNDVTAKFDEANKVFYAAVPYLSENEIAALKPVVDAAGAVYCHGYGSDSDSYTLLERGKGAVLSASEGKDFFSADLLCVDKEKNGARYSLFVRNNMLPCIRIESEGTVGSSWNENCSVFFDSNAAVGGSVRTKGKAGNYRLKLSKKGGLNSLPESKRWILYSLDESINFNGFTQVLSRSFIDYSWNPAATPVELIVNGEHKGLFLLSEEVRASNDKVSDGVIFELTDKADSDETYLVTDFSKTTCKVVDPDLEPGGSNFSKAKSLFNDFEKAVLGNDASSANLNKFIDLKSFADWYILMEVAKVPLNKFEDNCFVVFTDDGKLRMGPVDFQPNAFADDDYTGYCTRKNVWFKALFNNSEFVQTVLNRLDDLSGFNVNDFVSGLRYRLPQQFDSYAEWGGSSMNSTISKLSSDKENWIENRVDWLKSAVESELGLLKNMNPSSQNAISEFSLKANLNSGALLSDYTAKIEGDSIKVYVPYLVNFELVPTFSTSGSEVYADGMKISSNVSKVDFSKPVSLVVKAQNGSARKYVVNVVNSGIPVIFIDTENNAAINSKTVWVENSSMRVYREDGSLDYDSGDQKMNIRGRGNSTWDASQKKPYAIKLNKKAKILGLLEDKRWVLLANHYDRSFIRAGLASWLAKRLTNQDWSPSGFSTEVVLNGKHVGNYFFCEQVKISEDRVNAEYLLEVDTKAKTTMTSGDDISFTTKTTSNLFNIKDPDVATGDANYTYVENYINNVESVLYDDSKFLDADEGYKKYCDLESFVDWSLIKELSKDYDGNFFTSCHMNLTDGVLKMGPLWDFDLAFCNNPFAEMFGGGGFGGFGGFGGGGNGATTDYAYYNEPEGFHVLEADWLKRMMLDPEFKALMLKKINHLIEHEAEIMQYIDEQAALNINSFVVNETMWKTLGQSSFGWGGSNWNYDEASLLTHYREDIAKMKKFISDRLRWMQTQF